MQSHSHETVQNSTGSKIPRDTILSMQPSNEKQDYSSRIQRNTFFDEPSFSKSPEAMENPEDTKHLENSIDVERIDTAPLSMLASQAIEKSRE